MTTVPADYFHAMCCRHPSVWLQLAGMVEGAKGGLQEIQPNILQRRALHAWMARYKAGRPARLVGLKPRKRGFSTISTAVHYWMMRNAPTNVGLLGHQDNASTQTLYRMLETYRDNDRNADNWGNVPTKEAGDELRFSNGSTVMRFTAENPAKIRSSTVQAISATEWAYWRDSQKALQAALNAMPKDVFTSFIGESTPKGITGSFPTTWKLARWPTQEECPGGQMYWHQWASFLPDVENAGVPEEELFIRIFAAWFEFDDAFVRLTEAEKESIQNSLDREDWYFGEQDLIDRYLHTRPDGVQVLGQEVGHADVWEQLAWRRVRIKVDCDNDRRSFDEEYPSDPHTCIEENQRVATDCGLIKIKDVEVGMMTKNGRVTAKALMGVKPVVRITTSRGFQLLATADHRIALPSGSFIEAGASMGSEIVLQGAEFASHEYVEKWHDFGGVSCEQLITPEFGRFLGYFMGDGSLHNATLSIVCDKKDTDVVDDVSALLTSLFRQPNIRTPKGWAEVRLSDKRFHELFERLGIVKENPTGNSPHIRKVCVPECIWRSPRPVVREFLRGLFEADGWINSKGSAIKYFAKDPGFSREIQLLLLGFGIHSTLRCLVKKVGDKSYPGSELLIYKTQTDNFMREVGFVGRRKNQRQSLGSSANGRPAKQFTDVDTVVSIEPAGDAPVYDIQIDGRPVFSAQGLLVHNCFLSSGRPYFDPDSITTLDQYVRYAPPVDTGVLSWQVGQTDAVEWRSVRSDSHLFHVWEHPKERCSYVVAVDSATGENNVKGGDPDRHSVLVLRAPYRDHDGTIYRAKVVARVRPPCLVPLHTAADWAARLATYYQALLVPEINNTGQAIVVALRQFPHVRIARRSSGEDPRTGRRQKKVLVGHLTDASTRQAILDWLHKALRNEVLEVLCPSLIYELRIFNHDPDKGRPEAPDGEHDDDVMALAIGLHWLDSATPYVIQERPRGDINRDFRNPTAVFEGTAMLT